MVVRTAVQRAGTEFPSQYEILRPGAYNAREPEPLAQYFATIAAVVGRSNRATLAKWRRTSCESKTR
jgi:hypothetical protein